MSTPEQPEQQPEEQPEYDTSRRRMIQGSEARERRRRFAFAFSCVRVCVCACGRGSRRVCVQVTCFGFSLYCLMFLFCYVLSTVRRDKRS